MIRFASKLQRLAALSLLPVVYRRVAKRPKV